MQFTAKNRLPGPFERSGLVKGRDFVQFYVSGYLARDHSWTELYDAQRLRVSVSEIVPPAAGVVPAPVYPPQVAWFFTPWTKLGYLNARWLWFVVSATGYLAGIAVVIHGVDQLRPYRILAWVTASLSPTLAMVLTSGELSAAAMLFWALSGVAYARGRLLPCGICLGFLAYKPPLLIGVILALVVAKERTILTGIVLCGAAQIVLSVFFLGLEPWNAYMRSLLAFRRSYYLTDTLPNQKQSLLGFFQILLRIWPAFTLVGGSRRNRCSRTVETSRASHTEPLVHAHAGGLERAAEPTSLRLRSRRAHACLAHSRWRARANLGHAHRPGSRLVVVPRCSTRRIQDLSPYTCDCQLSTIVLVAFLVAVHRQWLSDTRGADA